MSEFLTLQQIVDADDMDFEVIEVPEWGGKVKLGSMTAGDRDAYEVAIYRSREKGGEEAALENVRSRLVAAALIEPKVSKGQVVKLAKKNARIVNQLFDAARRLNGISAEDAAELEGN